jgi:hypothetical protein
MSSNTVSDLLDLRRHILLLGEVNELLGSHLEAEIALRIAAVNGNGAHTHGPVLWSALLGQTFHL